MSHHYILGTAGHIDHGKTSLVRALTGTDTDRLPEERRRGMTIELGFAELTIGGTRFGIVDVPGHERFVRTMVAGATGIDIALIVVAADDSVMPQTVEHVEILHLLGVSRGVVAMTKTDKVDGDMVELVADEVRELLRDTPLENTAVCPVSSTTGQGIDDLKQHILSTCRGLDTHPGEPPFRMAIDRVFTIAGRGSVVTGSIQRGVVAEGDTLEVWPCGKTCRVRGLQSHGLAFDRLEQGRRAAVNVSGIDRAYLDRGGELATPGYLEPSPMIDVRIDCLPSCARPLKSTSIVRLETGTVEVPVRVVLLEEKALAPGGSSYAQLRSGQPLTTTYGQRFILRDENATRTLGGGLVLRPVGLRRRRDLPSYCQGLRKLETGDAADRMEEVLRVARFVKLTDLQLCARSGVELRDLTNVVQSLQRAGRQVTIAGTDTLAVPAAIDDLSRRMTAWLERHHRNHPDQPGQKGDTVLGWLERMAGRALARPLLEQFIETRTVKRLGHFICLPAFAPSLTPADEKLMASMVEEIRTGGFQPPDPEVEGAAKGVDRKRRERLITLALAMGELVRIDSKLLLHEQIEKQLRDRVAKLIHRQGSVSVSQVRKELDSSRKYVVPFLEYLDRVGFTKRIGDQRVLADAEKQSEGAPRKAQRDQG